jgi:hypothetical protein
MKEFELSMAQLRHVTHDVVNQLEKQPEKIDWARVNEDMAFARILFDRAYKEIKGNERRKDR